MKLTKDEHIVLDTLKLRDSKTVVTLIVETGIPMTRMRAALTGLEAKKLVIQYGLIGWGAL